MKETLETLYDVIQSRRQSPSEGSYTCYLFEQGLDKILKKVAEETGEVIIAAKNDMAHLSLSEQPSWSVRSTTYSTT